MYARQNYKSDILDCKYYYYFVFSLLGYWWQPKTLIKKRKKEIIELQAKPCGLFLGQFGWHIWDKFDHYKRNDIFWEVSDPSNYKKGRLQ